MKCSAPQPHLRIPRAQEPHVASSWGTAETGHFQHHGKFQWTEQFQEKTSLSNAEFISLNNGFDFLSPFVC